MKIAKQYVYLALFLSYLLIINFDHQNNNTGKQFDTEPLVIARKKLDLIERS